MMYPLLYLEFKIRDSRKHVNQRWDIQVRTPFLSPSLQTSISLPNSLYLSNEGLGGLFITSWRGEAGNRIVYGSRNDFPTLYITIITKSFERLRCRNLRRRLPWFARAFPLCRWAHAEHHEHPTEEPTLFSSHFIFYLFVFISWFFFS